MQVGFESEYWVVDGLNRLDESEARELRLRYADRLRRDVAGL